MCCCAMACVVPLPDCIEGMAAGLSAGRIGWGLAIRLVRALSGVWPLSPIRLIENPDHGFRAWLRAAYRLTCPMPLNWGHVLGGELLLGRFWILQFLIKEAVWAKLPNSILYAAKLCKEDLSHGLVQPLIGHAMIMTPLAIFACGHFVTGSVVQFSMPAQAANFSKLLCLCLLSLALMLW